MSNLETPSDLAPSTLNPTRRCSEMLTTGAAIPPLPAGEGWGEGESSRQRFMTVRPFQAQTNSNPKSTVDLGLEQLIRVENALLTSILRDHHHPFSSTMTRHLTRTNGNRTAARQKIYSTSLLIKVKKHARLRSSRQSYIANRKYLKAGLLHPCHLWLNVTP